MNFTRLLSLALLYSITVSLSATADDHESKFAADRIKLEEQIIAILYKKDVALPPAEEGGRRQIETFFADVPTDGRLLTERTAVFEGCVLVVRIMDHTPGEDIGGWWQSDERTNLAFIVTEPSLVEIDTRSYAELGRPWGSVSFDWKPEIEQRLQPMRRLASDILDEAITLYPSDLATRLPWLAKRYREELTDKIFLEAGSYTYHVGGAEIAAPSVFSPMMYLIKKELAASFVDLIHQYQTNYCGDLVDA